MVSFGPFYHRASLPLLSFGAMRLLLKVYARQLLPEPSATKGGCGIHLSMTKHLIVDPGGIAMGCRLWRHTDRNFEAVFMMPWRIDDELLLREWTNMPPICRRVVRRLDYLHTLAVPIKRVPSDCEVAAVNAKRRSSASNLDRSCRLDDLLTTSERSRRKCPVFRFVIDVGKVLRWCRAVSAAAIFALSEDNVMPILIAKRVIAIVAGDGAARLRRGLATAGPSCGVQRTDAELAEHGAEGDARARFRVLAPARAVESSRPREQAAEAGGDAGEEVGVAFLVVALAHRLAQGVGSHRPVEVDATLPQPVVELAAAEGSGGSCVDDAGGRRYLERLLRVVHVPHRRPFVFPSAADDGEFTNR